MPHINLKIKQDLTHQRLLEILHYDPNTGIFTWKIKLNDKISIGSKVGYFDSKGYLQTKIDKKAYRLHRLAFFYMTGKWPNNQIDHKDLNKSNNKWENLREATNQENMHNKKHMITNKLGIKGVYKHKNRYRAQITHNGKKIFLGSFVTLEEAKLAHDNAAKNLNGEFANGT